MSALFIRLILYFAVIASIIISLSDNRWARYLRHLAVHQYTITLNSVPLDNLLVSHNEVAQDIADVSQRPAGQNNLNTAKLMLISEVKTFAKEIYGLQQSKSYSRFVDLKRSALGYNITVVPEFSFQPIEFQFPIAGTFDYLGFFSEELKSEFVSYYKDRNNDVHVSEIGAYSTLGFFSDPVYSTYLQYSDFWLIRLVLHELAHEKLYFDGDTIFSENLASYIEKPAALAFLESRGSKMDVASPGKIIDQYTLFWEIISQTKQELQKLYNENLPSTEKRAKKRAIYAGLQNRLQNNLFNMKNLPAAKSLATATEINNATLIQYRRYTPHKNGFARVLKNCENNFECWFRKIKHLKECPKEQRQQFLVEDVELQDLLNSCLN